MRLLSKVFIFSLVAAALAAPAYAGPMGGGWGGGGGGGPPAGGAGPGPGPGSHFSGPSSQVSGSGFAPHWQAAPKAGFTPSRPKAGFAPSGKTGAWVYGHPNGSASWRRHHHPWPGGYVWNGPYYYTYGDYYYDETDVNDCWVYRKAYNRRHQFLGWTHVDICAVQ